MKEMETIQKKLEHGIVPYILSAKSLKGTIEYYLHHTYEYSKEVLPLLAGVGVGKPIIDHFDHPTEAISIETLGIFGTVAFIILAILRIRVNKEEVVKRVIGQKKIINQFKSIQLEVSIALQKTNPAEVINELIRIQQNIITIVNNGIQEDIWPFPGINPAVAAESRKVTKDYLNTLACADMANDPNSVANVELPDQNIN